MCSREWLYRDRERLRWLLQTLSGRTYRMYFWLLRCLGWCNLALSRTDHFQWRLLALKCRLQRFTLHFYRSSWSTLLVEAPCRSGREIYIWWFTRSMLSLLSCRRWQSDNFGFLIQTAPT